MKVTICFGLLGILALVAAVPSVESSAAVQDVQPYIPMAHAESDAMEQAQYPSPLQQRNDGTPLYEVQCNAPRELYVTDSQNPICIYPDTYQILLDRGVNLSMPPTLESVVQTVIEDMIALYDSDPDGAFAAISAMMSTDATYPFVLDSDVIIVAHGSNPDVVGVDSRDLTITSKSVEVIVAELQEGAVWVEYTFQNPASEAKQYKRALLVLHDGYVFGSGYFVTPESIVRGVVEDTVALYDSDPDGAFATITADMVGYPSYPFVIDSDGIVVAHGANPNHVGANSVLIESTGKSADMVISELEDGEMWVEYTFASPSTGADQHKRSLIMLHDGYIFGSGYYPIPESIVRSAVDETISLYDSDPDGAFATISAMMSTDPSYPFVGDSAANLVAHGSNPDLVGQNILTLIKYDMTLEMFISELQDGEFWYEYTFHNPATGTEQHKRALFVLHDGYIFGSGYYIASDDAMTDKMTDDAMTMTDTTSSLELTEEEIAWLKENGTIRVTYNSGWFPLEYADESGNFAGVMLEYAKEFSRQTGAEFVGTQSAIIWSEVAEMIRDGKADAMFSVIIFPERLEYMDFTSTHYSIETRIVTVNDRQISMDEANMKFLTIKGYDIASWLDENHPDLEYAVVDSFGEAFDMLSAGDGDALVSTWPVASYHAAQAGIDNIYDAGPTGYQYDLKVGYSNQNPVLGSILQKVVDNIPASQIEQWYADATS